MTSGEKKSHVSGGERVKSLLTIDAMLEVAELNARSVGATELVQKLQEARNLIKETTGKRGTNRMS